MMPSAAKESIRLSAQRTAVIGAGVVEIASRVLNPPFGLRDLPEEIARRAVLSAVRQLLGVQAEKDVIPHLGMDASFRAAVGRHLRGRDFKSITNTGMALAMLHRGLFEAARGEKPEQYDDPRPRNGKMEKLDKEQRANSMKTAIQSFVYHLACLTTENAQAAALVRRGMEGREQNADAARQLLLALEPHQFSQI